MGVIGIVLLVILIISAVLLVLVVLVQDDQGEGIGGIFGGGSNTAFGSRSGNVLTRVTTVLAAIFLVCCFGVAWVSRTPAGGDVLKKAQQQALTQKTDQSWFAPNATAPAANGTTPASTGGTTPAAGGTAGGATTGGTAPASGGTAGGATTGGTAPASGAGTSSSTSQGGR
jgi:preprotein translocase subunit SecG